MATLFKTEEMNLFMGDDDPAKGKALQLKSVKMVVMQDKMVDHHPAGAMFASKLSLRAFEALELGFKFNGTDPDALSQFGLYSLSRQKYSLYGAVVDLNLDVDVEDKIIVQGKLCKIEEDEFQRGELQGCDYMISEIMHFERYWATVEKYYYDFFTQVWRVDGNDQRASRRALLRMP